MLTRYFNARILRNHHFDDDEIWVKDGKIVEASSKADHNIDVEKFIIAPGYIDIQINGAFGFDFSSHKNCIEEVARGLPRSGTTSFLPTVISSTKEIYREILPGLQPRKIPSSAEVLGIHLEGPFFNPIFRGAHPKDCIANFIEGSSLEEFYGSLEGVKLVTIAPELSGSLEAISELSSKNIRISAGHSAATFCEMQKSIEKGLTMATHLFNSMSSIHHREPGIIGEVLSNDSLYYSLILDGVHVHPAIVKMAWNANPKGLVLISDSMAALGLPGGIYPIGQSKVEIKDGGKPYVFGTNTLAGSILTMDEAVKNLHAFTGCSFIEALEAASLKPAEVLGIQNIKGNLNPGADADFIVVNDHLEIKATYIAGVCVHKNLFIST